MSKSVFSFLILAVAAAGCGHTTSGSETADGLLRVYPTLVPTTAVQDAAPVARTEPIAVAEAPAAQTPAPAPAPAPAVDETPGTVAVRVKGAKRCRVRIGEQRLGKAPLEGIPVPPGSHRIFVKCPHRPMYSEVLEVYPGQAQSLLLKKADFKKKRVARN